MKLFVYKTLFVFICVFLLFEFTVGAKLNEYEKKLQLFQSDHGRETIRQKIRDEIKKSLEKENILSSEDKILIKSFIEKINNELR